MIFLTESGSTYEIDYDSKQFRRLGGNVPPTARTGVDGSWRGFAYASPTTVGHRLIVVWEEPKDLNENVKMTQTSRVAEIITRQSTQSE